MCGIAGIWNPAGAEEPLLRRMIATIRHRGPDEEGFLCQGPVGLGACRLSIIDLSHGQQPMSNEDGTLWIVFNGEIYNFPELRRRLEGRGHRFRTDSDTETVVHAYEEYGPDCAGQLQGMFAFALWDARARRLFFARDHLGQKPLYYSLSGDVLVFASEIKALLETPFCEARLNAAAMHDYMSLRCVPGEDTLFAGIRKLPPGHWMAYEGGRLEVRPYWDIDATRKLAEDEREIVERLRLLLVDTVRAHLISDVPVGAFLSGGIDSSLVAAIMATVAGRRISTFSIGVNEGDFNELPFARSVAERHGTEHHEFVVEPSLLTVLPRMIWHMDEPSDPFGMGVWFVSQLTRRHVKVVLGGDGGDELFGGYDRYLGNQLAEYYAFVPRAVRHSVLRPLLRRIPESFGYKSLAQKARWMDRMADREDGVRYAESAMFLRFSHERKRALFTESLWREVGGADSSLRLRELFDSPRVTDLVDRMLYTDVKTRLAEHLLLIVDRMTMAHSLEGRSPYLDPRVVEFAFSIPGDLKIRRRRLKHVQREVARTYLPPALVDRPKQGFGFPLGRWFRQDLAPLLQWLRARSLLVEAGYFERRGLRELVEEHLEGREDHNYRLWLVLNLELWYRLFVERASLDDVSSLIRSAGETSREAEPVLRTS